LECGESLIGSDSVVASFTRSKSNVDIGILANVTEVEVLDATALCTLKGTKFFGESFIGVSVGACPRGRELSSGKSSC
jgi:hypothetical protein